jgi:hypothetical protein
MRNIVVITTVVSMIAATVTYSFFPNLLVLGACPVGCCRGVGESVEFQSLFGIVILEKTSVY